MAISIVICSSFRFYPDVLELQKQLEEAGIRTEIPVPNEFLHPKKPWLLRNKLIISQPELFEAFWRNMELHRHRILETDIVYVYGGREGYVGNGVCSEMGFAYGIKKYCSYEKPRTILSSSELADIAMRGFIEEIIPPENLIKRL
ncbi:hypothetical protein J4221_01065 [Candidatus Pacearchaeota archaeon]|nr:hypothetical protein [Candidatus Pacearchaeota archaeon]